ncbi:GerAB/ArcD/ProY family transporter [Virgibacillus salinus]|uniref:Spore germination protein (Amino acid permease) n=1 Tax=Virgibacillus salinus TaxID=553311 RepID=A0A1H1CQZ7_9BACI|nr:GerAB/ArcD/ProY family transporter [Virgibacillus salinus]SDQ66747.1 spore germination protein (amino acid permease) [Virgibacillus salinus]
MVKVNDQVPALMVFFLISAAQTGVGVLGFQSVINKYAGHDAWISVIVAGLGFNIIIWIMYRILQNNDGAEIVSIHKFTYGKWLGGILSFIFSMYLILTSVVVLRTYIEIIQVWMFPYVKVWALLLLLIPLIYYIISGEFRIIVGVCFFGVLYPFFLIFTLFYPLKYSNLTNILPILDHSFTEILQSSSLAIFSFMGVSTLLVFYPFIRESRKSQKFAHIGNIYTTFLYVFICLVSYIYYNQSELQNILWATLGLWKIIEMPFLARFEYVGIATLFFSILPNVALYLWASTRSLHNLFGISHKKTAVFLLVIVYIACIITGGREFISFINNMTGKIGGILLFGYIPILFLINLIRRKVKRNAS